MVDAMNYMAKSGWVFEQAYYVTVSGQNVIHWLLSKEVMSDEEIKDGLDMMFQSEHRLTYKDIKPLLTKAIEMGSVQMVVLDYLQYLGRGMTEKEVAIMSKEIKTLALEFNIPFVVIVSLRKTEGGRNKRKCTEIEIEDYMGTGAIGYDCDCAMIASRKNLNNDFDNDSLWVKILKTRNAKLDYDNRSVS